MILEHSYVEPSPGRRQESQATEADTVWEVHADDDKAKLWIVC